MRVAVVASAQIFGGFQNLPPPQSLDFSAFFGLSHLFPPRLSISVIFDTDLVTSHFQSFDCDEDFQHSLSFCLLQIGELGGDLSEEYRRETANRVQWGPMKAMRNMVAHGYGKMDRRIIWETVTTDIPVLKAVCEEQLNI